MFSLPAPTDEGAAESVGGAFAKLSHKFMTSLAEAAVALAYQGHTSTPGVVKDLRALIERHRWQLRLHPMWNSVCMGGHHPHDGFIGRLARALGIELSPYEFGYDSGDQFLDQLESFVHWYSVPRSIAAHGEVLSHLQYIGSQLRARVGTSAAASSGQQLGKPCDAAGITIKEGVMHALDILKGDGKLVESLLNNQRLSRRVPLGEVPCSGCVACSPL
jgi:hypothetical protein